ncbi:integrase family protein [Ruegeria sp. HKCCA5763]|uniref:tyrosine-type recombinase/integrase n=1 Tax=Ruegeria sp. HKCCA5763 TaxID=2682987 RepID=UPI0014891726|nr:integrase family protein [Ruegeria sp. HKCCA5763]
MTDQTNVVRLADRREKEPRPASDRVNLTTSRIKSLKANGKRQRVADKDVVGLHLTISPTGAKSFLVRTRIGKGRGAVIDVTIGKTDVVSLAEARGRAKEILAQARLGIDPRQTASKEISVSDLVERFLERQRERGISRIDNQERCLVRLTQGLLQTPAQHVTQYQWNTALNRIHRKYGLSAAVDARKFGRSMMNWANGAGLVRNSEFLLIPVIEPTRAEMIETEARKGNRWTLRQKDWASFWEAASKLGDEVFAGYLRALALTGLRRNEAAQALWSDVDLVNRVWTIPAWNTKTAAARVVYMDDLLVSVLEQLPRTGDLVFAGRGGVVMSGWTQRVAKFSTIYGEQIALHGLRRGVKTALSELRVAQDVRDLALGHSRKGLDALYDKSELEDLRRDAQRQLEQAWQEAIR